AQHDGCRHERDDLKPSGVTSRPEPVRQRQEQRCEEDVTHGIAEPPRPPQHPEAVPALKSRRTERSSADRRGYRAADHGAEDYERRYLTETFEHSMYTGQFAQQPGADDRAQQIA